MDDFPRPPFTWTDAPDRLRRFEAANRRAWIEWLDSLTPQTSVEAFEDLCRLHPEVADDRLPKPPPVVLASIWKP